MDCLIGRVTRCVSWIVMSVIGYNMLVVAPLADGQVVIQEVLAGGGAAPSGWVFADEVLANPIDKTSYWLLDPGVVKDRIITKDYDLSAYSALVVNVDVATFGSGTCLPLLIEYSTDGGVSWNGSVHTTVTPLSSSYVAGGPVVIAGSFSVTTRLRFSANGGSGRSVRIQNLGITAMNPPSLTVSLNQSTVLENAGSSAVMGLVSRSGSTAEALVVALVSSDVSEAVVPLGVTIPAGADSVGFDLTAVNDGLPDGDQLVTITATASGCTAGSTTLVVQDDGDHWPIVISQYYEGAGSDKYIEIHNLTSDAVDLTGYRLTIWTNAATEGWKTNTGSPTNQSAMDGMVIPGHGYWLLKGSGSVLPAYASNNANSANLSAVGGFNGNDSVVLYHGATNELVNIVDAVSFTNSGNEGADTSFYRIADGVGYDVVVGTSVRTYPAVWVEVSLADVASASAGDAWRLDYDVPAQPPVLASFVLGRGAVATASGRVTLGYTSSEGIPLQYRVAETADFSGAAWQPLTAIGSCDLSVGTGVKTVYFQLKNDTGVSAVLSDTIERVVLSYAPSAVITQYYEPDGSGSNNKYLEFTNISGAAVDVSGWVLVRWTNQDAENWKITGCLANVSPNNVISLAALGTLSAGQTVVVAHASAAALVPPAALVSHNISHTGDDSYALYAGAPAPETLIDVVSFTLAGNEGADRSFVRRNNGQGFSFAAGSSVVNFADVWQDTALAVVAAAGAGANEQLGVYVPEVAGYSVWAGGVNHQSAELDFDGDGLANGVEYFMGTAGDVATPNPGVDGGKVTWPRAAGTTIASFRVEVSSDLNHWQDASVVYPGSVDVVSDLTKVVFTMPFGVGRVFCRLSVTP